VPINRDIRGQDNRSRETRVNERIRAREVRVIDEDGQMLGVMTSAAALALARERNLDLVEVQPMAVPPVCKILDWGRFKYEQSKKENEARKHQKVTQLREIRMKPRTGEHDIDVKVKKIFEFLAEGDKVKVSVTFRGRELAHPELGRTLLERITQDLKGAVTIERPPIMEGKMLSMIVSRAPGWEPQKKQSPPAAVAQPTLAPAPPRQPARPTPPPATSPASSADAHEEATGTPAAPEAASPPATQRTGTPEPASTAQ
jgi:translation initiation factor IF-3